jgi:hypothetical protein
VLYGLAFAWNRMLIDPDRRGLTICTDYAIFRASLDGTSTGIAEVLNPATFGIAVPSPHPLRNGMPAMLRITSRSAHSENCDITLRDLLGREVARMYRGDLGHEERTITWTPNGLAPGVYLMQLRGAGEVRTRRIVIE